MLDSPPISSWRSGVPSAPTSRTSICEPSPHMITSRSPAHATWGVPGLLPSALITIGAPIGAADGAYRASWICELAFHTTAISEPVHAMVWVAWMKVAPATVSGCDPTTLPVWSSTVSVAPPLRVSTA